MSDSKNNKTNDFLEDGINSIFGITLLIYSIFLIICLILNFKITIQIRDTELIVSDIVTVLLPCVITIISISFSISDNKIFGISLNEFKRLRNKKKYFNFQQMIYFIIFSFFFYALARSLKLQLNIILIDVVSIIYSLKFIHQDIPLIENDENKLIDEVLEMFKERTDSTYVINKDEGNIEEDLIKALGYIITSNGIELVLKKLEQTLDKKELTCALNTLLLINIDYLDSLIKEKEFLSLLVENGKLKTIIEISFKNINYLINGDKIESYCNLNHKEYGRINYSIYNIIYDLHKICEYKELGIFEDDFFKIIDKLDENQTLNYINKKYCKNSDIYLFKYLFLNNLIFKSIKDSKDFYFLNLVRYKEDNIPFIITEDAEFVFYLAIVLTSIENLNSSSKNDYIKNIGSFLNCSFVYGYKKINFYKYLNNLVMITPQINIINLLPIMLKLFKEIYSEEVNYPYYCFCINAWFELIILKFNYFNCFKAEEFDVMLEELNDSDKFILAKTLNDNWIRDLSDKNELKLKFINNIDAKTDKLAKSISNKFIKYLNNFINETFKKYVKNKYYLNKTKLDDLTSSYNKSLMECINYLSVYDSSVDLTKSQHNYSSTLKNDNLEYDISSFFYFKNEINKNFYCELQGFSLHDSKKISSKIDKIINEEDPKKNSYFFPSIDDKINLFKKIQDIDVDNFFDFDFLMWSNKAIKINIKLDSIDKITDETKIKSFINSFNKDADGLYYVYVPEIMTHIRLNEKELEEFILEVYYSINYSYGIKINESSILYIKNKL